MTSEHLPRQGLALVVTVLAASLAGVLLWPHLGQLAHRSAEVVPRDVSYVVVPHPDDEFQAWSLLEHDKSTYKVFVLATRGEETAFCEPEVLEKTADQRPLEPVPDPLPRGKWSDRCEKARLNSWVGYFTDMANVDPSIPGTFRRPRVAAPLPKSGTRICRFDESRDCVTDTSAMVWVDQEGRGALIAFNLGDADLTVEEVGWAVRTVRDNRHELGLNTELPDGRLIAASFSNRVFDCFSYPHRDHRAVHEALYGTEFAIGEQMAPTCANDPDASRSETVSNRSARAAFRIGPNGERLGAHTRNYGWLYNPYYKLDRKAQRRLFHTDQHFWVR